MQDQSVCMQGVGVAVRLSSPGKFSAMKCAPAICGIILLLVGRPLCFSQGTFQNLNFEAANIPSGTAVGSFLPSSEAMPGWTAYYNDPVFGTNVTPVAYDGLSLGGAIVAINDINTGFGFVPLQGQYSAYLSAEGWADRVSSSLVQTGSVPNGTMSLRIHMQGYSPLTVIALGGQTINMVPLQTFSNYTLYGGDISAFAGQVAALSITELPPLPPLNGTPSVVVDNIVFSQNPIPEPGALGLAALGALLVAFRRRERFPP